MPSSSFFMTTIILRSRRPGIARKMAAHGRK